MDHDAWSSVWKTDCFLAVCCRITGASGLEYIFARKCPLPSIALLTPDDRAGTASAAYEEQKPRARQNVIFELGYFIGRLGRNRVCALYRPGVEIPSDYSGVLYVELDERGGWRMALAKEMKAAGLPIDMNKAL